MWARRCGAPPLWPSRVKVFIQSFLTAALGIAVFNYMTSADVGYLDLSTPKYEEVLCLTKWPLRHESQSWFSKDMWIDWMAYNTDMLAFVRDHECNASHVVRESCSLIDVPLKDMQRKLGIPLGRTTEYQTDNETLEVYALFFLYFTLCLWVAVVIHDFTLLSRRNQGACLDLRGVDRQFPLFRKLFWFMGVKPWRQLMARSKGALKIVIGCLLPFVIAWAIGVFFLLICPACLILFLRYPIRLGRLQIFVLCFLITVLCLCMAIHLLVTLGNVNYRPRYAITWQASACSCGCVFSISSSGILQILTMAVVIGYKAVMLGFRCLKGLRRANWANLMTVMFAIPLTVYPSEWTSPDGKPIKFRQEGDPVQGEPAFDPFAMMDEQPDSATTTCDLRPTPTSENPSKSRKRPDATGVRLTGPRMPTVRLKEAEIYQEEVGCCGFPYLAKAGLSDEENPEEGEARLSQQSQDSAQPATAQKERAKDELGSVSV